jgi:hypothetical protein
MVVVTGWEIGIFVVVLLLLAVIAGILVLIFRR